MIKADGTTAVGRSLYAQDMRRLVAILGAVSALVAGFAQADITVDAGRGPVNVIVPSTYDPSVPMPLLLLLHGYTSSGSETEAILQLTPTAEARGFLYAYPDGTADPLGNRFWNATDACCDFFFSGVDDSTYLRALIEAIDTALTVDAERVFISGHSNGGFMAYRMACDHADRIAAVVSVAGATFNDPADCSPALPVHTLQVHGTADGTIAYDGGFTIATYPGAIGTTERWATYNGCSTTPAIDPLMLDLDSGLPGAETTVSRYRDGCQAGGSSALWTIDGGEHVPALTPVFNDLVVDFLYQIRFRDGFETGDLSAWTSAAL